MLCYLIYLVLKYPFQPLKTFDQTFTYVLWLNVGSNSEVHIVKNEFGSLAVSKTVYNAQNAANEAKILCFLNHPNIIRLLAIFPENPPKLILPLISFLPSLPSSKEYICHYMYQLLKVVSERFICHNFLRHWHTVLQKV